MDDATPTKPARGWHRLWLPAVFALVVAALYFGGFFDYVRGGRLKSDADGWKRWVQENLLLAVALYFLLYAGVTSLSLPVATPLSLFAGYLFDLWVGVPLVNLAATLGATVAFLSSRYVFGGLVRRRFGPRVEAIRRGFERDGAYYLFVLRASPVFPFWLVNLAMGLTSLRVGVYVLVTMAAMLPGTFVYVWAGREVGRIETPGDILTWPLLLSFTLLGVVPLALRLLVRGLRRRGEGGGGG